MSFNNRDFVINSAVIRELTAKERSWANQALAAYLEPHLDSPEYCGYVSLAWQPCILILEGKLHNHVKSMIETYTNRRFEPITEVEKIELDSIVEQYRLNPEITPRLRRV